MNLQSHDMRKEISVKNRGSSSSLDPVIENEIVNFTLKAEAVNTIAPLVQRLHSLYRKLKTGVVSAFWILTLLKTFNFHSRNWFSFEIFQSDNSGKKWASKNKLSHKALDASTVPAHPWPILSSTKRRVSTSYIPQHKAIFQSQKNKMRVSSREHKLRTWVYLEIQLPAVRNEHF